MSEYKTCTKCWQTKALTEFHKHARMPGGLRTRCKPCHRHEAKLWRDANPERHLATVTKWAEENKDRTAQIKRNYWKRHPDRVAVASRKWQQANKDHVRDVARVWANNNKEKINATQSKRRAKKAKNGIYFILPKELIKIYASPCFYCGSKDNIEADHVLAINRTGSHGIGNLLPACRSCNGSKGDKTIMEWRIWKLRKEESPQLPTQS